jgi:uncharacterized protein
MRAQAVARPVDVERVDLKVFNNLLLSDRLPRTRMMLSELDGFLTGIAIGPELIPPSEWLPRIWGGKAPELTVLDQAGPVVGLIMARYNEILREAADDVLAPVFWTTRDGECIASDWGEGFLRAIRLCGEAWDPLFASEQGTWLLPILSLCRRDGGPLLGLWPDADDHLLEQAVELIPYAAARIAAFWRGRRRARLEAGGAASKIGRNDPCPCGSGRKFKKCCQAV